MVCTGGCAGKVTEVWRSWGARTSNCRTDSRAQSPGGEGGVRKVCLVQTDEQGGHYSVAQLRCAQANAQDGSCGMRIVMPLHLLLRLFSVAGSAGHPCCSAGAMRSLARIEPAAGCTQLA